MTKVVKMKLTFCFVIAVVFIVIYSTNAELPEKSIQLRRPQNASQRRNVFTRTRKNRQLSNLMRIPRIICYYAKFGRWPEYNTSLKRLVQQFSRIVFSMSDESIKNYCTQVFQLNQLFRPVSGQRGITAPTRRGQPTTTTLRNLSPTPAFNPFFFTIVSSNPPTFPTTQTSTIARTTQSTTTPLTSTALPNGVITTTTTAAPPSGSASGSASGE